MIALPPYHAGDFMRYFFDIDDGVRHTRDEEGYEYSGLQEAHDAAIRTLPDIIRDVVCGDRQRVLAATASVRDVSGQVLFKLMLSLRTEYLAVSSDLSCQVAR